MKPAQAPPRLTIVQASNGTTTALLFNGEELPVPIQASASLDVGRDQLTRVSITVPCLSVEVVSEADVRRQVIDDARRRQSGGAAE